MKKLLTVMGLGLMLTAGVSTAQAAQCQAKLKGPRGLTLLTLNGNGYSRPAACQNALQKCRRAKNNGRFASRLLRCEIVQPMVTRQCNARVQSMRRGRPMVFHAQATGVLGSGVINRACAKALNKCVASLRQPRGRRVGPRGHRPLAKCVASNGQVRSAGSVVHPRPRPGRGPVVTPRPGRQIDPTPTPPRRGGSRGGRGGRL